MASSESGVIVRVARVLPLDPVTTRVTFEPTGNHRASETPVPGGYCRLRFPDGEAGPRERVFTYRRIHPDGSFEVDFARHEGGGPAARWIVRAGRGDEIGWRHGGPPKLSLQDAGTQRWVLWADATALPLVAALLETAPADLAATVVLDLPAAAVADLRRDLPGVEIVDRCDPATCAHEDFLCRLVPGAGLLFVACEAGRMRRIRRCALDTAGMAKDRVRTSGYWMAGRSAEDVDRLKRRRDWFGDSAPSGNDH